jgi:prepilin-type N-terminal cleavage/methylation domain-containing protein
MLRNRLPREVRVAFTLIELLVVIAIIAVLVGLTSAAVLRVLVKGPEIQAQSEIQQLAMAVSAFKQEFNVKTMPSRIVLFEDMSLYNSAVPLEAESRAYLGMMFGRRLQGQIDWNNDGTIQAGPAGRYELTGEQCLVFFLGGAKNPTAPAGVQGFSSSPTNPIQAGGTRRGPFFDFKSNRLRALPNGFYVYLDAFFPRNDRDHQPYAYLSDYSTNQYRNDSALVTPYRTNGTTGDFLNKGSFQIISAGADSVFGNPNTYRSSTGQSFINPNAPPNDGDGRDDFANFQRSRLANRQE